MTQRFFTAAVLVGAVLGLGAGSRAVASESIQQLRQEPIACRQSLGAKLHLKFYDDNSTCVQLGQQVNAATAAFIAIDNPDGDAPASKFTPDYLAEKRLL